MYTGFNPMGNELILANLADQKLPQHMILLPEPCRFVSFIEKSIQEEQTQFCLLVEEGKQGEPAAYRQLIISKQTPFKKMPQTKTESSLPNLGFNIRPLDWS